MGQKADSVCDDAVYLPGISSDANSIRKLDPKLQEKTYEEWKANRKTYSDPITKQDEIAARMAGMYNREYARYARNTGQSSLMSGDRDGTMRPMRDNRNLANGTRTSPYYILNEKEIESILHDADELKIPHDVLRFNEGRQTGFVDRLEIINIRGDILPDLSSSNLRDKLSQKAVLAHEYYGHYKHHPSNYRVGDWRDEFRASYKAAIDAPSLTENDRRDLMLDAFNRAKEAGVSVKYNSIAKELIYGYEQ